MGVSHYEAENSMGATLGSFTSRIGANHCMAHETVWNQVSENWQNDPATDNQKEKLRFFGCTWEGNITKGQASAAIGDCVQQFPDKEQQWQKRPSTAKQKKLLREMGEETSPDMSYSEAKDLLQDMEEVVSEEEEKKQEMEERIDDCLIDLYNAEYKPRVSRKRIKAAIQHLDKNKPGWRLSADLISTLETLKPPSKRRRSPQGQGCFGVLAICIVLVWVVVKFTLHQ